MPQFSVLTTTCSQHHIQLIPSVPDPHTRVQTVEPGRTTTAPDIRAATPAAPLSSAASPHSNHSQRAASRMASSDTSTMSSTCADTSSKLIEIGRAHVELQSLMRISYAVFCLKKT